MARCPSCGSTKTYSDGYRYLTNGEKTQRFYCKSCGLRFSKHSNTRLLSFSNRQVCETKNLAGVVIALETQTEKRTKAEAGAAQIINFAWQLQKQGYKEATIHSYVSVLKFLTRKGANLYDPESIKEVIAKHTCSDSYKWNMVKAYKAWLRINGGTWEAPRYKPVPKLPWIPQEREIDDLIAGCGLTMAILLQFLKETGTRRLEAWQLRWEELDFESKTVNITTRKGGTPRILKISDKLIGMLNKLPRETERVFNYKNTFYMGKTFRKQRKRIAAKLGNPRILKIHFHTLRHWRGTLEYHKTKDILHTMRFLGHRKIENTLIYMQLEQMLFKGDSEFICKVAHDVKEASELIEQGFEYICEYESQKLFKKPK